MADPNAKDSLIKTLQSIAADIRELEAEDIETIARIGAEIEAIFIELDNTYPSASGLFELILKGLQALYQKNVSDAVSLIHCMGLAAAAAEQVVAEAEDSESLASQIHAALNDVLARTITEDNSSQNRDSLSSDDPIPIQSLDDLAALLIQTDVEDLAGIKKLLDAIRNFSAKADGQSAKHLASASECLSRLLDGNTDDPQQEMQAAGEFLEHAIYSMEDSEINPSEDNNSDNSSSKETAVTDGSAEENVQMDEEQYLPDDVDVDLVAEFITESRELIAGAEAAMLSLETNIDDVEAINTVFRAFHTIKGTSAFLGLTTLSELAHKAENLLSRVRDKEITFTGGYADLALRATDMIKELLQSVQDALGGSPMTSPDGLRELITVLANPEASGISGDPSSEADDAPRLGDILVAGGKAERDEVEQAALNQGKEPIGVAIVRSETAKLQDVGKALRTQQRMKGADQAVESSVRVRTDRLDRLIDMVGELVIAHSMVAQDQVVVQVGNNELLKKVTHAGKIIRELQDLSMSMRMIPLKPTFQKMARLVRDLARKSGKIVNFVTEGEDTEIDRNMVDVINDPLVHMIRNACDHGIEHPEIREQNGKPKAGTVTLSAYHAGGNVVVELRDDGQGLDRDKIVEKAIARGLIESDKGMADSDIFGLIFEPGFSTADKVTDVSGRGVGMDVVKRAIESLRGRVDISSQKGQGTTFYIRLPLTMAVTDGMLVKVGSERFIIPTLNIHMSFRPDRDSLTTVAGRGELVMLRGELMPIIRLHRLFGIEDAIEDPANGLLVVVDDGDRRCALLIDELLGQQQVVAKPLGDGIGKVQGVSGGAILGDGCVGLILDPNGIAAAGRGHTTTVSAREMIMKLAA